MATYKCVINDGESNRLVIENITHIAERIYENKFKLNLTIGLDQVNHLEHLKWLYDHLENGNIKINNIKVYAELQKDFVIPSEPNILDQDSVDNSKSSESTQIPDENNSTVMPTEPIINKESQPATETESQPAMNSESEINQAIQSYNETEEKLLQEYTVFNRVQNISIAADSYDYGVFKANIELLSSPINEV